MIASKLCTQSDFSQPFYVENCSLIKEIPRLHRKQWEFAIIIEILKQNNMLQSNKKGLGFAVGMEPLPALFASLGCNIIASDLDIKDPKAELWTNGQLCYSLDSLNTRDICDKESFRKLVQYQPINMNYLPDNLELVDFTWSSCAFEHLGSIQNGLDFLENQLKYLKPGGIAVHTTEFNIQSLSGNSDTIDNEDTVLFRKQDFEQLREKIVQKGYIFNEIDYSEGSGEIDKHIDLPPYSSDNHLKLQLGKFVTTSIVLIIQKP